MAIEYKLPDLGEDIETGDIIVVLVSKGDKVDVDQPILELETDKAAIEIPSPSKGTILEVHVKEGETVKVGQLLVTIEDGKSNGKDNDVKKKEKKVEEKKKDSEEEKVEEISESEVKEETDADPEPETESSNDKDEEIEYEEEPVQQKSSDDEKSKSKNLVPASPTVRRLAREMGVDINEVEGSGPGGRILEEDVESFKPGKQKQAVKKSQETEAQKKDKKSADSSKDNDKWGAVERTPMSKVRTLTAERLTEAWNAPHVTQYDKADITDLEKLRKEFGSEVEKQGGKLTMTSIILKVIASALKSFPQFNASIDMENGEIIYKEYINIGVAVDTDRGLLVPVIKDADEKNITELSVELSELSEKARNKKISVDELQGGTFTISNLGGIGGTYFSPVVNAPEVAILGISRSAIEPVYKDGGFIPRLMLPLSLSYDHRLIDGADGIRFLRWVIEALEEPFKLPLVG